MKALSKSGAGANDVHIHLSEMFPYLSWLEPHFVDRLTSSNFQTSVEQMEADEFDEEDEEKEEEEGGDNRGYDDSISVSSEVSSVSQVTGTTSFRKRKRYFL